MKYYCCDFYRGWLQQAILEVVVKVVVVMGVGGCGFKNERELSNLKKCKQEERQIHILGILWLNNNLMSATQKFITKPQFISMWWYEFHLVHMKSQKLDLMWKTQVALDHGGRSIVCTGVPIPLKNTTSPFSPNAL